MLSTLGPKIHTYYLLLGEVDKQYPLRALGPYIVPTLGKLDAYRMLLPTTWSLGLRLHKRFRVYSLGFRPPQKYSLYFPLMEHQMDKKQEMKRNWG